MIIGEHAKHLKLELRKFEDNGGWKDKGNEMISETHTFNINYVNRIKYLQFNHFKHSWSTRFHAVHKWTLGTSKIYAVFTAIKKGAFTISVKDIEIPVKVISEKSPLKTFYGINCKREQIEENDGGITTTFHKMFTPNEVVLRIGDIIYFKVAEKASKKGDKPDFETIVFDMKK